LSQLELFREMGKLEGRVVSLEHRVEDLEEAGKARPAPSDERRVLGFGPRELTITVAGLAIIAGAGAAVVLVIFGNAKAFADFVELVRLIRGE
jgi:hypothetical protein